MGSSSSFRRTLPEPGETATTTGHAAAGERRLGHSRTPLHSRSKTNVGQVRTVANGSYPAERLVSVFFLVQDCLMPNYRWTCTACGETNDGMVGACVTCGCPACATVKQIAVAREHLASQGRVLREGAGVDIATELSAFDVLIGPALFLLLGWFPRWQRSR